MINRTISY